MSDYSELKTAATRIIEVQTSQDVPISKLFDEFDALASPEAVLALISEVDSLNDEISACKTSPGGCSYWKEAARMREQERDQLKAEVERPKKQDAWDGEGLPPVGTICEVLWNESRMEYLITKVFGVNEHGQPIHRFDEGPKKYQYQTDVLRTTSGTQVFRPIKTAEQLAEEEKKQEIDEMQRIYEESMLDYSSRLGHASRPAIKALYEAGYRKQ